MSEDQLPLKSWLLNYRAVQLPLDEVSYHEGIEILKSELPGYWNEIYTENLDRSAELCRLKAGGFSYVYDDYDDYDTMVAQGRQADDGSSESRVVAAFGHSAPPIQQRKDDDRSLKGWLGPTEQRFGRNFDKAYPVVIQIGAISMSGEQFACQTGRVLR